MRTRPLPLFAFLLGLLLAAGPASAAKVRSFHDPEFDFSQVKTYQFKPDQPKRNESLDRRIVASTGTLDPAAGVRYLGSILLREDEVVLCQFSGPLWAVREVVERAAVPLDRLLTSAVAPVPAGEGPGNPDTSD